MSSRALLLLIDRDNRTLPRSKLVEGSGGSDKNHTHRRTTDSALILSYASLTDPRQSPQKPNSASLRSGSSLPLDRATEIYALLELETSSLNTTELSCQVDGTEGSGIFWHMLEVANPNTVSMQARRREVIRGSPSGQFLSELNSGDGDETFPSVRVFYIILPLTLRYIFGAKTTDLCLGTRISSEHFRSEEIVIDVDDWCEGKGVSKRVYLFVQEDGKGKDGIRVQITLANTVQHDFVPATYLYLQQSRNSTSGSLRPLNVGLAMCPSFGGVLVIDAVVRGNVYDLQSLMGSKLLLVPGAPRCVTATYASLLVSMGQSYVHASRTIMPCAYIPSTLGQRVPRDRRSRKENVPPTN
ncbi:hypothetical protein DFS33DRAFT_1430359 [Desarmillaria ectypa]|nr:hypothetical protein DFS33DRAFT_1430359 [Desarmillaria ectypa]